MKTRSVQKLSLLMVSLWMAISANAAIGDKIYPSDNIIYEITSATEVKVVGYTNAYSITDLVLPPAIESGGVTYSVSAIGAFINNQVVRTIRIPGTVKAMTTHWQGFKGCSNLRSVTFEQGITTLAKGAFTNCTSLAEIVLPEGITELPTYVFQNTALETITLPASVTNVNSNAFAGCSNLTEIRYDGTTPPTFTKNSDGKNFSTVTLTVPQNTVAAFQGATVANPFKEIREDATLGIGNATTEWNPLVDVRKEDFLVYIVFGQSNAEGFEAIPTAEDKIPNPNLYNLIAYDNNDAEDGTGSILAPWGEWEKVAEPNCRKTKYHPTKMGWVKAFGEEMLSRHPDKRFAFVHVAVASAAIKLFDKAQYASYLADPGTSRWVKYKAQGAYAGNPYQRIIDAAKKAQQYGTIKAILMHQGEEDGGEAYWPSTVKKVYHDMLNDLNLTSGSVPLIMGEPTNYVGTIANQVAVTTEGNPHYIPNSYLIEASDLAYNNLHFTHDAYVELGKRYARQASNLLTTTGITVTPSYFPLNPETVQVNMVSEGDGQLRVEATTPLNCVKVISMDGKILEKISLSNESNAMLNMKEWAATPVVLCFEAANGTSVITKAYIK